MKPLSLAIFLYFFHFSLGAQAIKNYPIEGALIAATEYQQYHYFFYGSKNSSIVVIDKATFKDSTILTGFSWIQHVTVLPSGFLFFAYDDVIKKSILWYFDFE